MTGLVPKIAPSVATLMITWVNSSSIVIIYRLIVVVLVVPITTTSIICCAQLQPARPDFDSFLLVVPVYTLEFIASFALLQFFARTLARQGQETAELMSVKAASVGVVSLTFTTLQIAVAATAQIELSTQVCAL